MPTETPQRAVWERLTFARVRVLRELADGRSEREVAKRLQMTYNGTRSIVADLKAVTECHDVRELGRWWRASRSVWYESIGQEAGIVASERVRAEGE